MMGSSAQMLAAPGRLDDEIRWVHATDLPDPAPYLRGGELILTSALWYREAADSRRFAASLAARGVHALGVALFTGTTLPDGLIEACAEQDILLLLLPDIAFVDVTEMVITRLMEERRESSVRAVDTERQLAARLAHGDGVASLIDVLNGAVRVPCWLAWRDARTVAARPPRAEAIRAVWSEGFAASSRWRPVTEVGGPEGQRMTIVSLRSEPEFRSAPPTAVMVYEAPMSVVHANEATAVGLAERYFPLAAHDLLRAEENDRAVVAQAITRLAAIPYGVPWPAELIERCGLSAAGPLTVVVSAGGTTDPDLACDALAGAIRVSGVGPVIAVPGASVTGGLAVRGATAVAIAQADQHDIARPVTRALLDVLGPRAAVGLAASRPPHGVGGRPFAEAAQARRIAAMPGREQRWATSAEVGSHLLLLAQANEEVRRSLCALTIDPLRRYDAEHGTELVHTLRVFLDQTCSWQRAADALHLHVNSLRYRIRRIEELTGHSLADTAGRTDLFLGLQVADS